MGPKTLQELVIGSIIFMCVDRVIRFMSKQIIKSGTSEETSLRIEMMILFIVLILGLKFFVQ